MPLPVVPRDWSPIIELAEQKYFIETHLSPPLGDIRIRLDCYKRISDVEDHACRKQSLTQT